MPGPGSTLTLPPRLLTAVLPRFPAEADGRKDQVRIALNDYVFVPTFVGQGTDLSYTKYQLRSLVYHLGHSPHTGHYRSGLFEPSTEEALNTSLYSRAHVTDDDTEATRATPDTYSDIECNCYLLFLTRVEPMQLPE